MALAVLVAAAVVVLLRDGGKKEESHDAELAAIDQIGKTVSQAEQVASPLATYAKQYSKTEPPAPFSVSRPLSLHLSLPPAAPGRGSQQQAIVELSAAVDDLRQVRPRLDTLAIVLSALQQGDPPGGVDIAGGRSDGEVAKRLLGDANVHLTSLASGELSALAAAKDGLSTDERHTVAGQIGDLRRRLQKLTVASDSITRITGSIDGNLHALSTFEQGAADVAQRGKEACGFQGPTNITARGVPCSEAIRLSSAAVAQVDGSASPFSVGGYACSYADQYTITCDKGGVSFTLYLP
jgi:hypothetical protein